MKSLQQFALEKNVRQAVRFDLNPSSKVTAAYRARWGEAASAVTFELLSLLLYAVEALPLSDPVPAKHGASDGCEEVVGGACGRQNQA